QVRDLHSTAPASRTHSYILRALLRVEAAHAIARAARLWHLPTMSSQPDLARLLTTPDPPQLGPTPRVSAWSQGKIASELKGALGNSRVPAERQELIRALVLLWHDHLETAHEIAQGIDSSDAAFVHGIMHRREPDYGNAAYWFRRVGNHPAFTKIAEKVP